MGGVVSFLDSGSASFGQIAVGVLTVIIVRNVVERIRYIRLVKELPGPTLRFNDNEWMHPFFAHFAPVVQSVGSIPKFPYVANALWWYIKLGNSFAQYGLCHLWAFHPYYVPFARSTTLIFDDGVARQLLEDRITSSKLVKGRRVYAIAQPLIKDSFLALPDGPDWKHQRRRAAASFRGEFLEHVCEVSIWLLETQVFPQWQSTTPFDDKAEAVPVEGLSLASRLTLEILGHVAFDYSFGGLKETMTTNGNSEENRTLYDDYTNMMTYCSLRTVAPPLVHKLWWKENAQFQRRSQRLDKVIGDIVHKRLDAQLKEEAKVASSNVGSADTHTGDENRNISKNLVDYFAQKDDEGNRLSFDYIFGNIRMFFFAGHDTTAGTLANALWHLATHPKQQKFLQDEVDELYGNLDGRQAGPSYKALTQLRYLDAVVRECLRLWSPGIVARTATEAIQLTGRNGQRYNFPAGHSFYVIPFVGHMCESYWEHATEFRPGRFLSTPVTTTTNGNDFTSNRSHDGNGKDDPNRNTNPNKPNPWIPFSVGARHCVAQPMAIAELKCLLAHICRNYTLRPQSDAEPPINTIFLTVKPHDVAIEVTRRKH